MPVFNYAGKEVNVKVVYYGPGLSGKTTNIQYIHDNIRPDLKGKLVSLATQTDRTLFFDFLPMDLGSLGGYKIRLHLYTVPGQVHYNATRKLVLQGVDGIVFVADSQKTMRDANIESFRNLNQNLESYGKSLKDLPHVIQANKRDLPDLVSMDEINAQLNPFGAPLFEATASDGAGVLDCLRTILRLVMGKLKYQFPMGAMGEEPAAPAGAGDGRGGPATGVAAEGVPGAKPLDGDDAHPVGGPVEETDGISEEPVGRVTEALEGGVEDEAVDEPPPDQAAEDIRDGSGPTTGENGEAVLSVSAPISVDLSPEVPFSGSDSEVVTRVDVPGLGEIEVKVFIQVRPVDVDPVRAPYGADAEPAAEAEEALVDLPAESPPLDGAPPDMPYIDEEPPPSLDRPVEDLGEMGGEIIEEDHAAGEREEEPVIDIEEVYDPSYKEIEFSEGTAENESSGGKKDKLKGLKGFFGRKK